MLIESRSIVRRDITAYDNQFISVDGLIQTISQCLPKEQKTDILDWIEINQDSFNQLFPLIKISNKIMPYTLYQQSFFNWHDEPIASPHQYLKHLINGGYEQDFDHRELLGFAKYQTLVILERLEIQIKPSHWKDVKPYIPPKSEVDKIDPYTVERLAYYELMVKHLSNQKIVDDSNLSFKMQVALKAHHRINVLHHYGGESSYKAKIKLFLEEMAYQDDRYKPLKGNKTFIEMVIAIINTDTKEYMKNIITPE